MANWSVAVRVMGSVIAVLLAITMAVFPVAMPRAAASSGAEHGMALEVHHAHHAGSASCDAGAHGEPAGSHDPSSHGCCGMGVCHAFQVSPVATVFSPHRAGAAMACSGDEQVGGIDSGRLERPPRTV